MRVWLVIVHGPWSLAVGLLDDLLSLDDDAELGRLLDPRPDGHLAGAVVERCRRGRRRRRCRRRSKASLLGPVDEVDELRKPLGDHLPDGGLADEHQEDEEPPQHVQDPNDAEDNLKMNHN